MRSFACVAAVGWLCGCAGTAAVAPEPVPDAEAAAWLRWLTPLPKQVQITGKVTVPVAALRFRPPNAPGPGRVALEELATLLSAKTGLDVQPFAAPTDSTFLIDLPRQSPDAALLRGQPNRDQAYTIKPVPGGDARVLGLRCSALSDVGRYYAVTTLKQFIMPTLRNDGNTWTVDVPVCTLVDWPDLEERGEWGGSCAQDLEWLSDHKFNLIERHAKVTVDAAGHAQATMDMELMAQAHRCAVRIVPIIHHLEQLARSGLFRVYPNLKAEGAENSICFAQPEIVTVLAKWLTDLGQIPGVFDVMIWLSEEGKGCACEDCVKNNRFVNETRVCVAAWERAQETAPHLGLRLLLTQASYGSNQDILAAVPAGVKVSYYHGGLTYNTSRSPMIYPLLEDYAKQGRWLGVYPTLGASWRIVAPFSNPWFVHFRLNEFVQDGLDCLVGYTVPANALYRMNVEAAMEWAWNAGGRSPGEFACSFATRHGIRSPERFADWCELLSPVSWDVYGSGFPYREAYGGTDGIVRGSIKIGTGIFAEFSREEQLAEDLSTCEEALALAVDIGYEPAVLETRIVRDYVQVLKCVWELSKLVHKDKVEAEERATARRCFDTFFTSCNSLAALYPKWAEAVAPDLEKRQSARFWDTVAVMERLAARMGTIMEDCGFVDQDKPYRLHTIGTWKTEEFEEKQGQTRRLEVSALVDGPGIYRFQPKYRGGTLGLTASCVQLASFAKDAPDSIRVEAQDEHSCHAGAWVKDDIYRLELQAFDPTREYAVIARIRGGPTTKGEFLFRKLRQE